MKSIFELRIWMDIEIKEWKSYSKQLASFKEIPQFLDLFSNKDIVEINNTEREIVKLLERLFKIEKIISTDEVYLFGIDKAIETLKDSERSRKIIWLFIEKSKTNVFKIKPTVWNFLFYPYKTMKFILAKYIHRLRMKRLDKKDFL